jgi:hypothetical protein
MKVTLLLITGALSLGLVGCSTDQAPDERPKVSFGNDQFREEVYSRATPPATDLEKTVW